MLLWSVMRNTAKMRAMDRGTRAVTSRLLESFGGHKVVQSAWIRAFPLAQQLRCVTIEMSRVVCASTCTTRIQFMLLPVYSLKSFSSCSVQNCHVLHLGCQPSTARHSLLSLPIASCWCSTVSFESGNDAVSHRCLFVKARDVAHCVLRSVTR